MKGSGYIRKLTAAGMLILIVATAGCITPPGQTATQSDTTAQQQTQ